MAKNVSDNWQDSLKDEVPRNMEDNPDARSNCSKPQIN